MATEVAWAWNFLLRRRTASSEVVDEVTVFEEVQQEPSIVTELTQLVVFLGSSVSIEITGSESEELVAEVFGIVDEGSEVPPKEPYASFASSKGIVYQIRE
jgi:hypothetical protein